MPKIRSCTIARLEAALLTAREPHADATIVLEADAVPLRANVVDDRLVLWYRTDGLDHVPSSHRRFDLIEGFGSYPENYEYWATWCTPSGTILHMVTERVPAAHRSATVDQSPAWHSRIFIEPNTPPLQVWRDAAGAFSFSIGEDPRSQRFTADQLQNIANNASMIDSPRHHR